MKDVVGIATCDNINAFIFDPYRCISLKNTIIEESLELDTVVQWYQLTNSKSIKQVPRMTNNFAGALSFDLNLQLNEPIVVHFGESSSVGYNFLSTGFQTGFDSIESLLKIR